MKKLIILLSIAIAASSILAQASKPAQQTSSNKSWIGPVALVVGGLATWKITDFYQKTEKHMCAKHRLDLSCANKIIKDEKNARDITIYPGTKKVKLEGTFTNKDGKEEKFWSRSEVHPEYSKIKRACDAASTSRPFNAGFSELIPLHLDGQTDTEIESYINSKTPSWKYSALKWSGLGLVGFGGISAFLAYKKNSAN